MFSISLPEVEILNELKNIVLTGNGSLETIIKKCKEVSPLIDNTHFPYIYSATLLAAEDRVESAIKLYDFCPNNVFAQIVKKYLEEYGSLIPRVQVFKDNAPYSAWAKTNLAKNYIKKTVNTVIDFYSVNFSPEQDKITILDIGTGNGVLIAKIVNKIIEKSAVKNVNLILLDQSQDMLTAAEKHCRNDINAKLTITNLCCKINEINKEQLSIIKAKKPIHFVNCAMSIHHFSSDVKLHVLELLKSFSSFCLISEPNCNHDIPEKYSPELIYAVSTNMHYFFSNIIESDITEAEKKIAIEQFLLAEAINIIRQPKNSRIDYHTKIREWAKLAEAAGYDINSITPTVKEKNRIAVFTMILKAS